MICPNCGKEYNQRMTCCISCGADLVPLEDTGQTALELPDPAEFSPEIPERADVIRAAPGHSAVPEPTPEPEEVPLQMKAGTNPLIAANPFVTAARFAVSLPVSLLMLAFLLLFTVSAALRLATSDRAIEEFSGSLDLLSLPAAAVPTEGYDVAEDATVREAVYVMSRGTGLTRDDIGAIYETSTIKDFLAAELKDYADYLRTGSAPEPLTTDKLKAVYSENIGVITSAMGIPLSEHDIGLAYSEIEKLEPLLEKLSPAALEDTLGAAGITALRVMCSLPALIVPVALAIAMLPLLKVINKSYGKMLRWGGGAFLAAGAVTAPAVFLLTIAPRDTLLGAITACAAGTLSPELFSLSAAMAAAGVIMLLTAKIIKN